jgi:MAP3K TRAFs-binding domain
VVLFVEGTVIPFDIALVRGIPYRTDGAGEPVELEAPTQAITQHLRAARDNPHADSPLFQLIDDLPHTQIDHAKTDVFREQVDYSKKYKARLAAAVEAGRDAVQAIADEPALANLHEVETGVVVDLFLSLRDVEAHAAMVALYERMPPPLQRAKLMREQLGFALNRAERFEEAEKVLKAVIAEFGPSSETNGLLGRIYKDRWEMARDQGRPEARSLLRRAIDTYLEGFQADWRDAYPGINALTLMERLDKPDPRKEQLLPVVHYAVSRKAEKNPDYWDYATLLELAVLANDRDDAQDKLSDATSVECTAWMLKSTARNLGLTRAAREARHEDAAWIADLEKGLLEKAARLAPAP